MSAKDIANELAYLRDLVRDRSVTMAEVSGETLRYLLARARLDDVLAESKRLGQDSPLSTATDFMEAERAKDDALKGEATS